MGLDVKDIIPIVNERIAAINTCWNIYIAVCTGVLGLMASGRTFTSKYTFKILASFGFGVFAIANFLSILKISSQRSALLNLLPNEGISHLINAYRPDPLWQYFLTHFILDAAVILCIWLVKWESTKS